MSRHAVPPRGDVAGIAGRGSAPSLREFAKSGNLQNASAKTPRDEVGHPTAKQMSSFSHLYWVGHATIPKRASPVSIRQYANNGFAYATFSTGSGSRR
jgi:hypothetical protein